MKQKIRIFIIALAIVIFFGNRNFFALPIPIGTFSDFVNAIANNNFNIQLTAPDYQWTQSLTINNNGIIRGGIGNNSVILYGGTLFQGFTVDGRTVIFYGNFNFEDFHSLNSNYGGAIYAENSNINFTSSVVNFTGNTAVGIGGAIYAKSSNILFENVILSFRANQGEEIFAIKSTITFGGSFSEVAFISDQYWNMTLDENTRLNLDVGGRDGRLIFTDGLRVRGGEITKNGEGSSEFTGETNLFSKLNIVSGKIHFKEPFVLVSSINVSRSAVLSFKDNGFNQIVVKDIEISGALEIDINFSSPIAQEEQSDKLLSYGKIKLLDGSSLIINPILHETWEPDAVVVIATGTVVIGGFSGYDKLRYTVYSELDRVIVKNTALYPYIADVYRELKNDRFLAHVIARTAISNPGIFIYHHIKRNLVSWLDNNGDGKQIFYFRSAWAESFISKAEIDETKDDKAHFRDSRFGIRSGINILEDEVKVVGFFGSAYHDQIRQYRNSANVNSLEVGAYGAIFSNIFKHKFFMSIGRHDAQTEKHIIFLNQYLKPQASFYLTSFKYGLESSVDIPFDFPTYFPYAKSLFFVGLQRSLIYNDDINESGGGIANTTVEANRYERMAGYFGIRLEGRKWFGDARMNYFLKGKNEESNFRILWKPYNYKEYRVDAEGANNDLVSFALNFGTEHEIAKDILLYGSVGFEISRDFREQNGEMRVGIKYLFATKDSAPAYKEHVRQINEQKQKEKDDLAALKQRLKEAESEQKELQKAENARLARERAEQKKSERLELTAEKARLARERAEQKERNRIERTAERIRLLHEAANLRKNYRTNREDQRMSFTNKTFEQKRRENLSEAQERRKRGLQSYKVKAGFFEVNSDVLMQQAYANISAIAAEIKKRNFKMITVEGHTDSMGSEELNMDLSERRAMAVYNEFLKNGLPENKMRIAAFGYMMPVADNTTPEGRAANRRVEVFVE